MNKYHIPGVKTFEYTKIIGLENIEFGRNVIIDDFVLIYAKSKIKIGSYVHIACFTSITGGEKFEMGDFSGISQGCRILTGTEDFKSWGFGNPTIDEKYRNTERAPVYMGRFCLVGANSVILPGVTIGEGAVVGAGSVVSKDLQPWGIYLGNRKTGERDRENVLKTHDRFFHDHAGKSNG
ncbi:MAG: acyltransferase [bacterium]